MKWNQVQTVKASVCQSQMCLSQNPSYRHLFVTQLYAGRKCEKWTNWCWVNYVRRYFCNTCFLFDYLKDNVCCTPKHTQWAQCVFLAPISGDDTFKTITFSWQRGLCVTILFSMLKIVKKTLTEICREVLHIQVGLEKETEAHRIDALCQKMKLRRLRIRSFLWAFLQNLYPFTKSKS